MRNSIAMLIFLVIYIGGFLLFSLLWCIWFHWNEVITSVPWIMIYLVFGWIPGGIVAEDYLKLHKNG